MNLKIKMSQSKKKSIKCFKHMAIGETLVGDVDDDDDCRGKASQGCKVKNQYNELFSNPL